MRQLNNHIKEVVNPEKVIKTSPIIRKESFLGSKEQPKPSANPKNWNWTAIIAWSVLGTVAASLATLLINLIF